MIAVHCFDLDGFKPVNDRHGHPVGDILLMTLAERIRTILRASDVAARTGGDEFVVIQAPIHHAEEAEIFARRLARVITAPYDVNGHSIRVGVSIGYATAPPSERTLDQLIASGDVALYQIKQKGGGVERGDAALIA